MVDNVFDALDAEPNALTVAPPAQEENPFSAFDQDPVPPSPANETVTPKTSPMSAPPLEQEMLDGISISTARESAKARTEAEVKAPRMETPEEASFWGAAEHALGNQNLEAIAETLDHISDANGDPKLREWADGIRKSVKEDGSSYKAVYESYRNVRGLGDAWGYVKERAGQMVGVMAPSIIGSIALGAGGAYAGGQLGGRPGAIVGGTAGSMAGSVAGSVHLHIADMRQALKREGVQGEDLVSYTNTGAAILGSLDMLFPALQGAKIGGFARKALADKVADKLVQNLANGGKMRTAAEFVKLWGKELAKDTLLLEVPTELMQQGVSDLGSKWAAGKQISSGDVEKFATETAPEVVLSTIIGAGFMGAPGSAIQAGRAITEVKAGSPSSAQPAAPAPAAPAGPTATPSNAAAKGDLENAPPPAPVDGTPAAAAAAEPGQADPAEEAPAPDTGTKTKSVVEFIRENGGLQPSGELDAVDAQRYPGIVSEGGLTAEEMRERLVDAGYLRETPSDQPNVTTPSDVYDLVRRATSGDRIVPVEEKAADDLYFENEGAQDPQKELAHAEKMFVAPALERYDEELGDPIYSQTFKKLEPAQRIEAIDRARRGEDIADVLEDLAFQDVLFGKATDTETLQLMIAKRGPNPELIDRIRSTLAQRQPELLRGFDDLVASLPVRRDTSGRAPLAEASHPVVTGLGKRLQAVSHDDKLFELSMAEVERDSQIDANDMRIVAADYLGYVPKVTSKEALVNLIRSSQRRARAIGAATARGTGAKPAVPVSKSLTPGAVVSLYDGSRHSDITTHLAEKGVTLDQYQKEFRLPDDYPTLAANEIARRFADASQEAKDAGIDAFERQFTIAGIRAAEEAARAEQQAAQPEAAPAKTEKPEPKPDLGLAFAQLIAGKTPRDQWAKTLGVSEAELKPHIERAVASGLLRKDRRGVVRRAAETIQAMGEPDALADSYAARLEAALGKPEFDTVYAEMAADRQMTRERVSRVASLFVSQTARGAKKSDSLQRIRSRHDNLVDARAKDAVLTAMARGVAGLIAPGEMAGQPMVATSPAILKAKQLQAAVDKAVAKILPRAVRADVVDNIKIGKLAREDELLALRSSSSDIMPDTDTDGDGDGLSDAGGAAGKTGAQKNQKRRGSRKIADPGIGSAGIGTSAAERRILRQESATLRADGSIIVGRRSSEGRSAAARTRDDAPIQAIGTTERIDVPGFVGTVSAANVVPHETLAARNAPESEYRLATLTYRLYPEDTSFPPSPRDIAIIWAQVSQHLDGSWEVSMVQRNDYDQGGRGLSQQLYAAIEKDLGIHMSPSGLLMEPGFKMWQKRSPKSVQWHQYSAFEDAYISPRRVKDRLGAIGQEIAAIARRPDSDPNKQADLKHARKERGELIRLWGKLPDEARAATPNMFSIRAFHGSPHDFDRFDMSAIGTGEGAQSFGHGLYFAENEAVAKSYQDNLSNILVDGKVADIRSWDYAWAKAKLDGTLDESIRDYRARRQRLLSRPANTPGRRWDINELTDQLERMERVAKADVRREGNLYEVDIDVEPEQLLDWDKPLNEQPPAVQAAIRKLGIEPVAYRNGQWLYEELWRRIDGDRDEVSAMLREAGVPGIRYLDEGSRDTLDNRVLYQNKPIPGEDPIMRAAARFLQENKGDQKAALAEAEKTLKWSREDVDAVKSLISSGDFSLKEPSQTRNIVIFDDSLIKITHKNGKPVTGEERRAAIDELMTLREDSQSPDLGLQALGKTDPYALQILISMQGVEAEAARTGKSATDVATSTARHEALEFFKASDLIQPQEWDALVAAARAENWIEETGVRAPYEKLYADLPEADREEIILKEAIMEKYANFDAGKYQPKGAIAKVFQRIKDFIARLRGLVKEQGFSTWQEIFEAVDQGKLRERYEQLFGVETEGDARSAGNGAKSVAEQGAAGDAQPMIRAGQLPDARTFSNAANLNPVGVQPLRGVTEIINDLKRAMGMTVRTGRLDPGLKRQAKQAGGDLFGQYNGVARTKIARDIDTIAHEGGHHMERLLGAKLQAEMQRFDFELLPLATPGAPLSEGFAEFFRRYVTNPMMADVRAPGFYQAFENLVDAERPQMLEQLQRVQNDYTALMLGDPVEQGIANQTVLRRAVGSFGRLLADVERDGMVSTIGDRLHQLYASMVSSHHGWWMATRDLLVEAERRTGVRATLKAIDNPYKMIRLAGHTASWATQDLKRGIAMRARPNGGGVSMHQVLATAFGGTQPDQWNERSTQEFGEYLIARRAIREYVRYNPAFRTQIQQFVAANPSLGFLLHRLPQNTTPELDRPPVKEPLFHQLNKLKLLEQRSPQFRQAAELYYEFNRDIIRFLYEKQLITREERDEYLKEKDYAPFQRDMSDREMAEGETKASRRSGRARDQMNKRAVFDRFQGSMRDIINPVQSTVQMVYEMRLRAAVNDTLRALDRLATQAGPGGKEIFERLPPNEARAMEVKVREALKDAARQANMSPTDTQIMLTNVENQIGKNAVAKLFTMQQASEKGEKIVWFFENGKPVPAQLADGTLGHMMFQSLTAMGERGGDTLTKVLAAPANAVRAGVTFSWAFALRNLWVDGLMAPLNSPHIHVPFGNVARGIPEMLFNGQNRRAYNRYAGMMGGELYTSISDQSIERDVKALRERGFDIRRYKNLREIMRLLMRPDKLALGTFLLGEKAETAGRVGIFKAAKDSAIADGMSEFDASIEAAHYAHDIMDFSRHGSKTELARRVVPFFNAAIQGFDKYIRTLGAHNDYGGLLTIWAQHRAGRPLSLVEKRALGHAAKAWFITTAVFGGISALLYALNDGDEDIEDIPDNIRATHWIISLRGVYHLLPKSLSSFIALEEDTRIRLPKGFETAWFANATERALDYVKKNDPAAFQRFLSDIWATILPPDGVPSLDLLYGFWTGKDMHTGRDIIPNWEKELERTEQFGPYTTQTAREIGKQINMSPYYVDYLVRGLGASLGRDVTTGIDQMIGKGPAPSIEDFPIAQRFTHNPARSSRSLSVFYDKLHGKEGVVAWFWDTVESDAKSFGSAGATYKRFVDSGQQALADDFYARLNPDQKAFATLAVDFRGRKAKLRNLHPILNAQEAVSVTNAMVKEVIEGQVKIGKDEERKSLSRDQMRMVREELRHIQRGMAQNALKILSVDGWSSQPMADVDKRMNVLKAISPEVFSEYQRRLESKDVQSFSHLAKVWPKVREELLAQRGEAEIGEYSDGKIYAD